MVPASTGLDYELSKTRSIVGTAKNTTEENDAKRTFEKVVLEDDGEKKVKTEVKAEKKIELKPEVKADVKITVKSETKNEVKAQD